MITGQQILKYIHDNGRVTKNDVIKDLGLNAGTVRGMLSKLKKEKLLIHDINDGLWWLPPHIDFMLFSPQEGVRA